MISLCTSGKIQLVLRIACYNCMIHLEKDLNLVIASLWICIYGIQSVAEDRGKFNTSLAVS